MTTVAGSGIFYAVLVAPGFLSVMITISLSAIEDDVKQFVLLVWSLVTSLVIDTLFLTVYQWRNDPITNFEEISNLLFEPQFRSDYIAAIFIFSIFVGILYSIGILVDIPGKLRSILQSWREVSYTPEQPWVGFMRNAGIIRIKTSDDQLFMGPVVGWSRAERRREVRISEPKRYNSGIKEFEPVGGHEMLFIDEDIDRVVMLTGVKRSSKLRVAVINPIQRGFDRFLAPFSSIFAAIEVSIFTK